MLQFKLWGLFKKIEHIMIMYSYRLLLCRREYSTLKLNHKYVNLSCLFSSLHMCINCTKESGSRETEGQQLEPNSTCYCSTPTEE
ncbi:hypothetical protein GDO86_013321 [Hymenochirus boettgeri]|uniref:Uncharacterized protein n=1 Tax=Hymenochirus boettgeri TaxID=247094 RepID=A0A8T2IYV2_9PIPI|nr:hypothetical protein GDO86_013321 [Hymenochirus boettgeri]